MKKHYGLFVLCLLCLWGCQPTQPIDLVTNQLPISTAKFTLDGWQVDTVYRGADYKSYLTHFVSESVGYLVSTNYADVLKTTDGGRSWATQATPMKTGIASPTSIDFLDEQTGVITFQRNGGGPDRYSTVPSLIRTRDGGKTWTLVEAAINGTLSNAHFLTVDEGVATLLELFTINQVITSRRSVVRTTDGGASWQPVSDVTIGPSTTDVFFANRLVGFIRGLDRQLYRTLSGGRDWQRIDGLLPVGSQYAPVVFYDELQGYVSANSDCYRTTDGGMSWQVLWQGNSDVLGFVNDKEQFFIRTTKVYNHGDYSEVERELRQTTDGGQTFRSYPAVFNLRHPYVRFISDRVGYGTYANNLFRFSRK